MKGKKMFEVFYMDKRFGKSPIGTYSTKEDAIMCRKAAQNSYKLSKVMIRKL